MQALKDIYTNKNILKQLARDMQATYPPLNEQKYYAALVKNLDQLELKARIEQVADVTHTFLPPDYSQAIAILYRFVQGKENRLIYLFLPTFVAKYGNKNYKKSIKALRDFTEFSSSEEGIRAYLVSDLTNTLNEMLKWTRSNNTHIRRLASEGCRPRLPWAKKIPALLENPELSWSILDALKNDPEKYVQKSVANHINDISKDHPDWIVKKVSDWDLEQPATAWIIKHGMRGLVKSGHKGALQLFGYGQKPKVQLSQIKWDKSVGLNETWQFSLEMSNLNGKPQDILIDYQIFFLKKNGQQNPKTFKITTRHLLPEGRITIKAKYTFKDYTTRKHYRGPHAWQLLVNGVAFDKHEFTVK